MRKSAFCRRCGDTFFRTYGAGDCRRQSGGGFVARSATPCYHSFARSRRHKLHIACFAAKRQKCAHLAASPLKNATTTLGCVFGNIMSPKKRASRGSAPLILPIAHDVVVADCAKLAPSKSAALTRSVAPPLKNTNTSFGLCFCNLSLRTCVVAGMPVKLQYSLSSHIESNL